MLSLKAQTHLWDKGAKVTGKVFKRLPDLRSLPNQEGITTSWPMGYVMVGYRAPDDYPGETWEFTVIHTPEEQHLYSLGPTILRLPYDQFIPDPKEAGVKFTGSKSTHTIDEVPIDVQSVLKAITDEQFDAAFENTRSLGGSIYYRF